MKENLNLTIDSASSTINEINTNTEYFKRKKFLVFKKNHFFGVQDIEVVNLSNLS